MSTRTRSSLFDHAWRYGVVGVINTIVGLSVIMALHIVVGLGVIVSNIAGYALGWALSFILNRSWTFAHDGPAARAALAWVVLVLFAFGANLLILAGLQVLGFVYGIAQIAGSAAYSVIVFIGARYVIFNRGR